MLDNSFLFRVARAVRARLCQNLRRGVWRATRPDTGRARRPPAPGLERSPPIAVREVASGAAVMRSRVVGPDGSPCSPRCATNFADPFSVLHVGLLSK